MASVRTNIVNALGWFYERLTKKDLDPMRASISELADTGSCFKAESFDVVLHSEYVDDPHLLWGGDRYAYVLLFNDSAAYSVYGGGTSVIYGYYYSNGAYGSQICMKYNHGPWHRTCNNSVWSDWAEL